MKVIDESATMGRLLLLAAVIFISSCAAPIDYPMVQDLSIKARLSERLPVAFQSNTEPAMRKPSVLPKLQPQAVTITAQPQTNKIQAANIVENSSLVVSGQTTSANAAPVTLPASDQGVVEQLLVKADLLKAQGKATQAIIQLQRAQRIAPRDPKVYARLAALKLSLGEALKAEQLALKGLTLVPQKKNYQYYFWKLIAASRNHLEDVSGESRAISEAEKYK